MKLQVLIATHRSLDKAARMRLPQVPGVGYLVSCQSEPTELPPSLVRDDIEVHFTDSKGISNNRNNAMRMATAPYCLMADDDLDYSAEGLQGVIDAFARNPDVDVALFRYVVRPTDCKHEFGDLPFAKPYPPQERDMAKPFKGYYVGAIEIAVRLESARRAGLRFNPLISFGSPYLGCGEEDLFMEMAKRKGLRRKFFPITVCSHPAGSTGTSRQNDPGILRAQGAIIMLSAPLTSPARLLLKAKRGDGPFFKRLWHLAQGAAYALRHRRSLLR